MRNRLIAAGLAVMLGGWVAPAWAEHEKSSSVDLNVDLRVNRDGFRLGGQLLGLGHTYGAWLNGEVRPDGLRLDGQVQDGGHAFNFKLNADIAWWLLRAVGGNPI